MAGVRIAQLPRRGKAVTASIVISLFIIILIFSIVAPGASAQGFPPKKITTEWTHFDQNGKPVAAAQKPEEKGYFPSWTTAEKWWLAASTAAMVVDWGQTRHIASHPETFSERNTILGSHPSQGTVDAYFAAGLIGTALIAYALPRGWRTAFLIGTTALSVGCVVNNVGLGVGLEW
jgi:hypothetical protein